MVPFLNRIKLIKFKDVGVEKCRIKISNAYKSRDTMVIHLLTQWIDNVSKKPTILHSHIIPYFHLYGNNKLIDGKDQDLISRIHQLYSLTVKYLSLRWSYFNTPKNLYFSNEYETYYMYYFDKLLIENFPKLIDYQTLAQSFNITFSFDIKKKEEIKNDSDGILSDGASSNLSNVVFTDNVKNSHLSHFNGESLADLFNKMCLKVMDKIVFHIIDNLSLQYQFGEADGDDNEVKKFESMIVNVCKLCMVCNCMDNMIKLDDLNYGLFLCKKLFDINPKNQMLMKRILVTFSDIISKCNHLTRKDHCLKWYFNLTDNIDWKSKL